MASVRADAVGYNIEVTAPLTYATRMKEVPGGRYSSKSKSWIFPLTWAHCVMLRGTFGDDLEVGPALRDFAVAETARRIRPAMEAREA